MTIEQASQQNRLALRRTCGALASGTRVSITNTNGLVYDVEARINVVRHKHENIGTEEKPRWKHTEVDRRKFWHHELVTLQDLVILRRRRDVSATTG